MKDDEFKQKLSEVAEWEIPKLSQTEIKEARQRARGRRSNEELYQEEHEQVFLELFEGVNPTYPPNLTKIKHAPTICECGRVCSDGCEKEAKLYQKGKEKYWRWKCKSCGMTQDPYTGEYKLDSIKASVVWNSFLRDTKGAYASKGNKVKSQGITRSHPDTNDPL